jgi:hypothetical protein
LIWGPHADAPNGEWVESVPEKIIIYHFIQKITLKVEVVVHDHGKDRLKELYFCRKAPTYFLSRDSMGQFKKKASLISTKEKRSALANTFDQWQIEMKENEKLYKANRAGFERSKDSAQRKNFRDMYLLGLIQIALWGFLYCTNE